MTFRHQYVIGYPVLSLQSLLFIKKLSLLELDQLTMYKLQLVYVSKKISKRKERSGQKYIGAKTKVSYEMQGFENGPNIT